LRKRNYTQIVKWKFNSPGRGKQKRLKMNSYSIYKIAVHYDDYKLAVWAEDESFKVSTLEEAIPDIEFIILMKKMTQFMAVINVISRG